jgi:hypothetical protein
MDNCEKFQEQYDKLIENMEDLKKLISENKCSIVNGKVTKIPDTLHYMELCLIGESQYEDSGCYKMYREFIELDENTLKAFVPTSTVCAHVDVSVNNAGGEKVTLSSSYQYIPYSYNIISGPNDLREGQSGEYVVQIQDVYGNAITTNEKKLTMPTHVQLNQDCGLNQKSVVMLEQIRTVDKSRLKLKIGQCNDRTLYLVNEAIKMSFFMTDK